MILKGESAEEFNRKADENYEKYKARQKQNLIDMMEADEKLGLYEKPKKLYTITDWEQVISEHGTAAEFAIFIINETIANVEPYQNGTGLHIDYETIYKNCLPKEVD